MEQLSGTVQFLTVESLTGSTYYLRSEEKVEVRMNQSVAPEDIAIGEEISVFIYPNSRGELFATPILPDATVDKYGFAAVTSVDRDGAWITVGSPRDILVPWIDLPKVKDVWPKPGDKLYLRLRAERDNQLFGRLITEQEVNERYTKVNADTYRELKNTWLKARPYRLLRIGTFLLTEDGYKMFVHESERENEPRLGEEVGVRVIGLNEEGELNGTFRQKSYKARGEDADKILDYMQNNDGMMPLSDKSDPEHIKEAFGISKGAFKRAVGKLMKENVVKQHDGQTVLIDEEK